MERAEAEAVYEQGRETVVAVLLELSAQNALLRREVADLRERVAQQEERIAELERRLNRNSRNSSLPPSQDPPAAPERRQAPPSGRGRGAQPGHSGHGLHLAPLESIDAVIEHWPARCACGHRFSETERRPVGTPARHQVAELPSIAVILSEHRLQRLRCPQCGAVTRAALPAGVPAGAFGPRLQAAVATLAVRNRVSRRDTTELLRELFGAQLSSGSVEAMSAARAPLWRSPTKTCSATCAARRPSTSTRPAGACAAASARSGGRSRAAPPSSASPRVATSARLRRCSARSSPASPARTAGGPTTTSTQSDVSSAGRTWSATSPPTARASAPRSSSAPPASRSPQGCSQPGQRSAGTLTARACLRVSTRSRRSSARCSGRRRERAPVIAATAASPRTS